MYTFINVVTWYYAYVSGVHSHTGSAACCGVRRRNQSCLDRCCAPQHSALVRMLTAYSTCLIAMAPACVDVRRPASSCVALRRQCVCEQDLRTRKFIGEYDSYMYVVDVSTINQFKARLDKFWMQQDVWHDYTQPTWPEIDQYMKQMHCVVLYVVMLDRCGHWGFTPASVDARRVELSRIVFVKLLISQIWIRSSVAADGPHEAYNMSVEILSLITTLL